jgi:hypothetical protein
VRIVPNGASGSSRHTHVPNCALNARIGKLGRCRLRNKGVKGKFERLFLRDVSQKEERHEYDTRIKDGLVNLHRQMDTQDFVFS